MLYNLRCPTFTPFNFDHCKKFFETFGFPHLITRFEYANGLRDTILATLKDSIAGGHNRPEILIEQLEKYAAIIDSICAELYPNKETIVNQTKTNGIVKWTSFMSNKQKPFAQSSNYFHEQAQVYIVLAIQYFKLADNMYKQVDMSDGLSEGDIPLIQEIMSNLRRAAGLFQHCAESFFPFALTTKTPDQSSDVCRGLSRMCIAAAQEFLIIIAVTQRKSHGLVAKLAQGVAETYQDIPVQWKKQTNRNTYESIHPQLILFLDTRSNHYRGIAQKYMCKEMRTDEKCMWGHAVLYGDVACQIIKRTIASLNLTKHTKNMKHSSLKNLKKALQDQLRSCDKLHSEAKDDNDTIYHELIPDNPELLEQPAPKVMVKAIAPETFEMPSDMPVIEFGNEWSDYTGKWKDEDQNFITISRAGGFFYEGLGQFRQGSLNENNEVLVMYGSQEFKGILVNGDEIEWSNSRCWSRVSG